MRQALRRSAILGGSIETRFSRSTSRDVSTKRSCRENEFFTRRTSPDNYFDKSTAARRGKKEDSAKLICAVLAINGLVNIQIY